MPLTITPYADRSTAAKRFVMGDRRVVFADVTFDSSYPTGGEAIVPADFGLDTQIDHVVTNPTLDGKNQVAYDHANKKLLVLFEDQTSGKHAEAASESDQSETVVRVLVFGK